MSDQPVTPDREALIEATAMALHQACVAHWGRLEAINERYRIEITRHGVDAHDGSAALAVDSLLPLLTEALDQAGQQGKREGREEAAAAVELLRSSSAKGYQNVLTHAARLARGPNWLIDDDWGPLPRLARGGPNRKDEE